MFRLYARFYVLRRPRRETLYRGGYSRLRMLFP